MKILFIGMGSIGMRHYKCLKVLKEKYHLEFLSYRSNAGICKEDLKPDVKYFNELEQIWVERPDCAVIANPTSLHVESAIECAKRGMHLFIEKPLSNTMHRLDEIDYEVKKHNLITLIGCNLRYHPVLKRIKQIVQNADMGHVLDFNINVGSYLPDWRPKQDYRESYSALRQLGGGVVLDLIHEIDYAYWVFGEFADICAFTGRQSSLEIETEDCAKIIVKTNAGVLGTISLNYYQRTPCRKVWINFEGGCLDADIINGILSIYTDGSCKTESYIVERDDMYIEQMDYFIQSILSGKDTNININEGIKVLEYALKIKGEHIK